MNLHRVVGDAGDLARISLTLVDTDGTPITAGSVTIRAAKLFTGPMSHDADGIWTYDPQEGDLSTFGHFDLEVEVDGVTLPAERPDVLVVRSQVPAVP